MIDFSKILKQKSASSLLGLALDGNRLDAVVLRRSNGSLLVQQTLSVPLALSPFTGDPELAGREIRNHLNAAGIRERRCVVSLPASLVMSQQVKLPELPEADLQSFLQIEAERGFPSGPENLMIADSRVRLGGEQHATLLAIPRGPIMALESVLKSAQLKPVSFSLGVAALDSAEEALSLLVGAGNIDLLVTGGGGIVSLRSLDGALEGEGAQKRIDSDLVAREIRITLGQLPGVVVERLKAVKVFGRGEPARQLADGIAPRVASLGLKPEVVDRVSAAEFDKALPPEIAVSPALALAAKQLKGIATPEFLPPKVHPWQQFLSAKFSSKKLAWAGMGAAALVLMVGGAFGAQQWQIARLNSKWKAIEPKVKELQAAQEEIKRFRPWFDDTFRGMRILKRLTEAFPEDGHVSAKNLEIRDLSTVTCSGVARDNQSYQKLLDQLRSAKEVTDLKTDQIRGQSPLQFTFNLQWEGGKSSGN